MVFFQFVIFKKIYEDIYKNNMNFEIQFKNKNIDEDLIEYFNFLSI